MSQIEISIVIPVYRAQDHIEKTIDVILRDMSLPADQYEIVLVNDGSPDQSWKHIEKICQKYPNVVGVDLAKNFGQDNAILAGLRLGRGKYLVIMDDDLQHDPKDISRLWAEIKNKDLDVVYAHFDDKKQTLIKNLGSWFNGKVANIVINKPDHVYLSPFKIISSYMAKEIVKYDGPYPYVDGLIFRTTNKIGEIPALHHARQIGQGNFTILKSFRVWLNLATSFSIIPLRASIIMGFSASFLAFGLALFYIFEYFFADRGPSGWSSLITTLLFFSGIQLISIGIVGEYIGRTHIHVNRSPQSVLRKILRSGSES